MVESNDIRDTRARGNPSDPVHRAEFEHLLEHLGVEFKRRDGWQRVRCWNRDAHRRGDRTPSATVRLETCGYKCHVCGAKGGLVALRRAAGITTATSTSTTASISRTLDLLGRLCSPEADPLAHVPTEAVEELRRRTGRHKRDGTLSANLARVLASIHARMTTVDRTTGVRYTAADAERDGIPAGLWAHLVSLRLDRLDGPLISALGITVTVGESGRMCTRGSRFRGSGDNGTFRATEVKCEYPTLLKTASNGERNRSLRDIHNRRSAGPEAVRRASLAACAPPDLYASLHRRRTIALLLADLDGSETLLPATGGLDEWTRSGTRTMADLELIYGKRRARRAVSIAEEFGWVRVVRPDDAPWHGIVALTVDGERRLHLDVGRGTRARNARVDVAADAWKDKQRRLRREASERARALALSHVAGTETPWVPAGDDRLRHVHTGEILPRTALVGAS